MPCIPSARDITSLYPVNNIATIRTSSTQPARVQATNLHEEMSVNFVDLLCSIHCSTTSQLRVRAEPKLSERKYRSCRCRTFTFTQKVLVCPYLLFLPSSFAVVMLGQAIALFLWCVASRMTMDQSQFTFNHDKSCHHAPKFLWLLQYDFVVSAISVVVSAISVCGQCNMTYILLGNNIATGYNRLLLSYMYYT